jgi:hypothetical protein
MEFSKSHASCDYDKNKRTITILYLLDIENNTISNLN